ESGEPDAGLQIEDFLEDPPPPMENLRQVRYDGKPARIDWAGLDDANRKLGSSGEKFVEELERRHLIAIGRPDLADRVENIAETKGDGAGYDVLSFTDDGEPKPIEVKTTNGGKHRPFPLSANELYQSGHLQGYWLYRVYRASGKRKLFRVPGPLKACL